MRIFIELGGGLFYRLIWIEVMKDGSFMLNCPHVKAEKFLIAKIRVPSVHTAECYIPINLSETYETTSVPKISFHSSGFVQISGVGVSSGEGRKSVNGVSIKSYRLTRNSIIGNDGFRRIAGTYLIRPDEYLIQTVPAKLDIILSPTNYLKLKRKTKYKFGNIILEFFVLPTNGTFVINDHINFFHFGYGKVKLRYIADIGDGSILLACLCIVADGNSNELIAGSMLSVGPSIPIYIDEIEYYDELSIASPKTLFPFEDNVNSLDYQVMN